MAVIKTITLRERASCDKGTKHFLGQGQNQAAFPPFASLAIAQYSGDSGYSLLHHCENGMEADTYHATLDEAYQQAKYEFGIEPKDWEEGNMVDAHR
jgi:hypothetical protein